MHWTIIFLLGSFIKTIHSQTWVGTYIINSTCNTASCCCFSDDIVVTSPSSNVLAFNTTLIGLCDRLTTYNSETTYPSGYTTTLSMNVLGFTITVTATLSNDSNTISLTNSLMPTCIGTAIRLITVVETNTTGGTAVQNDMNIIMLFIVVLFSCIKTF